MFPANLGLRMVKLRVWLFGSSNLATNFSVLASKGSPIVPVELLAYTFLPQTAVGSSGADGSTKTFPGVQHKSYVFSGLQSKRGFPKQIRNH